VYRFESFSKDGGFVVRASKMLLIDIQMSCPLPNPQQILPRFSRQILAWNPMKPFL
jgi:hypothetical protein